ncbi:MAG: DEAD/DEAH box helicase [Alphaproteobacteria bacterium]|nr:DEAD/DEAH box helicase [Alphaproteobacteria bacterium]
MTQDFSQFGLPAKLMQSLVRMQFTAPTPVQAQAIPIAMADRDILGSAQTGTGKTAAFGIPLVAKMMERPEGNALVLAPTRELAAQVQATLCQLIPVQDIRTALLIGGEPMPRQFRQLQNRPRIIVGTPGRVNDHLMRGTLKLGSTRFLVLDEIDRILDMGFAAQLEKIIKQVPVERQTLMFSATLPDKIVKLAARYLRDPERIAVGSTTTPSAKIVQEQIQTTDGEKYKSLLTQLGQRSGSIIVFVRTKHGAARMADKLCRDKHPASAIHGNLKQSQRDRVIQGFRDRKHRILVATDVAARGLDIPHIEHVINYDLPQCPEDYIHRIGRTARAGAEGAAVNLITPSDGEKWQAINWLMNPHEKPANPGRSGPRNKRFRKRFRHGGGKNHRGRGGGGRNSGAPGTQPRAAA